MPRNYQIVMLDPERYDLRNPTGESLGIYGEAGTGTKGWTTAVGELTRIISAQLAAAGDEGDGGDEGTNDGLLAEGWMSNKGIAFKEKLAGGRDFSECEFIWRDPAANLVPLFMQTANEGHYGAELVGFFTEIELSGNAVKARGRLYDTEGGNEMHGYLLDGRPFGISVDPGEDLDIDYSFECTQWDDEGFCEMGEEKILFLRYEIAGATAHPLQGFDDASIIMDEKPAAASARPAVRAALTIPTRPPRDWFTLEEPQAGVPFLDGMGEDFLVEQLDKHNRVVGQAVPLTITDEGQVYGHLTFWGQCHVGDPWGPGSCAAPEPSGDGYREFHAGEMVCADGSKVPVGRLTVGCEHGTAMSASGVRDHLAHAGMGWGSVHVIDGEFGPWVAGVLEPDITEAQLRVLRTLSMSGEWVGELGGILAVNASGLPIQRARLAASFSAKPEFLVPQVVVRASARGGEQRRLVGGNVVRACADCARRKATRASATDPVLNEILGHVRAIDHRTRGLTASAAEAVRASLRG